MAKLPRLKAIRERRALTQFQLAEKANINRVSLARLETGAASARPATVRTLADALGVEPAELMDAGLTDDVADVTLVDDYLVIKLRDGREVRLPVDYVRSLVG